MEFQLQADQTRPQLLGIRKEEDKENIPPLLAGSSVVLLIHPYLLKRKPLQDITHLFATITNANTVHNGRRMLSAADMELIASSRNKKRKTTDLSSDNNSSSLNLKRHMLRKSFR
ncbi:hypothetical protein KI387_037314 [Taxus chinensis]|uniref:Uncharacterized protein n=1 Tax=Taxus chinensis TaxID=29808 RepID=A0AA38FV15_TAXCH|nr:hypothetical protein KI387_037314 [Taxus chinensis]